MPKAEWGLKKICYKCDIKFYDLNRKPAVCPKCDTEIEETETISSINSNKQVYNDNLNTSVDNNLVGSDPSESLAEVEDISIDDAIDDDTISLDDSENDTDVNVIDEEVDDLGMGNDSESEVIVDED